MAVYLDPWQEEFLKYKGDKLLCTGRRVGKTYIMARGAVDEMAHRKNCPVIIVSLTEDQAEVILAMAHNYAMEKYPGLIGRGRKRTTLKSMYINGNRMLVRPVGATGDSLRGFEGGILIVDEASRMPERFWIAATPILLTTGGSMWLGSTPHGKVGYFWERFNEAYNKKEPNARFKVFYISTEQVIQDRPITSTWTEEQRAGAFRILSEDKKAMTPTRYGQEYLGLFLDELQRLIPEEWIERVCTLSKDPKRPGERFLGVDIGRMYDPSSFEDVAKLGDKIFHCDSQTTTRTTTVETQNKIIQMDLAVNYTEIGIDAGSGSLGVGVYDNLMVTDVRRKLKAMNNREIALDRDGKKTQRLMKEDFYNNMIALGWAGTLKLLKDENVINSLRSLQWEVIGDEERSSKVRIFGNNTHIAEGLIRAVHLASKSKSSNIWIKSI